MLPTEHIWDICNMITETYDKGVTDGASRVLRSFLDGRIQKRRRNGRVYAEEWSEKNWEARKAAKRAS